MQPDPNPYASPKSIDAGSFPSLDLAPKWARPYVSNSGLALFLVVMLGASVAMDVVSIGSTYLQIDLLNRALEHQLVQEDVEANDSRQRLVLVVQLVVFFVSGIVFLVWMHHAHRNLPALHAKHLKYSPGWAAGAWFVPILNLFRPYQIMQEIWRGSDPANLKASDLYVQRAGGSSLVGWWWGLWIINNIVGNIVARPALSEKPTIESLIALSWAEVASSAITIVCGLLAIAIVRSIDANQEQRYVDVSEKPPMGNKPIFSGLE